MQEGPVTYSDGSMYEGESNEHGMRHGKGRLTFANGDVYQGDFADDQMHGQGRYMYSNRSIYDGSFVEGQQHGSGTYEWAVGTRYVGPFANGQPHGHSGTLYFDFKGNAAASRANSYTCKWVNGQLAGKGGMYIDHDGKQIQAQAHEDIQALVDYKMLPQHGQHTGKFYFNGGSYEGAWNDKLPHGNPPLPPIFLFNPGICSHNRSCICVQGGES
jgi:hypothetical protein